MLFDDAVFAGASAVCFVYKYKWYIFIFGVYSFLLLSFRVNVCIECDYMRSFCVGLCVCAFVLCLRVLCSYVVCVCVISAMRRR